MGRVLRPVDGVGRWQGLLTVGRALVPGNFCAVILTVISKAADSLFVAHPLDDPRLDRSFLRKFDFDEAGIRAAMDRVRAGELTTDSSRITGRIEPAPEVRDLDFEAEDAPGIAAEGEAALRRAEVAVVVLNGGMATRFGGVVKGVVEVFDGLTFIALKARDVQRAADHYGAAIPLVLMNSFATEDETAEHVEAHDRFGLAQDDLLAFHQSISVRLTPQGELFVDEDDRPSYHAPGHGDFFRSIRVSGVLGRLRDRGVRYILFSNVDNLGATVDPLVVGHHVVSGKAMTAEVTQKRRTASGAWDKGGAPALVDGRLQIVEGFRFPPDFPQETLPDFSTNNMIFSVDHLERDIPLQRHLVTKKVDGRPALQLESIACEASGVYVGGSPYLPLNLLRVPREGPKGRFFPVKEPVDLDAMRSVLKARLT